MWEANLMIITTQVLILAVLGWGGYEYIRLRRRMRYCVKTLRATMNCDELIDQLLEGEDQETPMPTTTSTAISTTETTRTGTAKKRERLAALSAGGQAKQYLGRVIMVDQVDDMSDDEVQKLYSRYEARLGAEMTKTLGAGALQLYATAASVILPIPSENVPLLVHDLEVDPFVGHALSTATCELYHRYGMYLAPLTAALTTAKHCRIKPSGPCKITDDDVGPDTTSGCTAASCRDSTAGGFSREGDITGTPQPNEKP